MLGPDGMSIGLGIFLASEASAPEVHSPEEAKKGETAAGVPVKRTPSNAKTVTGH